MKHKGTMQKNANRNNTYMNVSFQEIWMDILRDSEKVKKSCSSCGIVSINNV